MATALVGTSGSHASSSQSATALVGGSQLLLLLLLALFVSSSEAAGDLMVVDWVRFGTLGGPGEEEEEEEEQEPVVEFFAAAAKPSGRYAPCVAMMAPTLDARSRMSASLCCWDRVSSEGSSFTMQEKSVALIWRRTHSA